MNRLPQLWFGPITPLFWSEYSEAPFENCIDCGGGLLDCDLYIVQKRFVGTEAVFEMAMCRTCREKLNDECSEETMKAIGDFVRQHLGSIEFPDGEVPQGEDLLSFCIDHCVICRRDRSKCHRYSIAGHFRGMEIIVELNPVGRSVVMMCSDCEESLAELVSKKTRDTWERFVDEHFDGPPGLELNVPTTAPMVL